MKGINKSVRYRDRERKIRRKTEIRSGSRGQLPRVNTVYELKDRTCMKNGNMMGHVEISNSFHSAIKQEETEP